jgi:serpin B
MFVDEFLIFMIMRTNILYLCLIPLLCWACNKAPSIEDKPETPKETPEVPEEPETPKTPVARLKIPIEPQERVWVANGNNFAADLLAKAVEEAEANTENVMLSPLSLQLALGMLANGVTDEAFAEMASAMGFDDGSIAAMNSYFHKLSAALTEGELDVELALANSIWVQEGFQVNDAFIQTNKDVYKADVSNVNFADPATLDLINSWCDKHTRGTIKEIPLELSGLTRLVLANATYFNGSWTLPFDKTETGPGVFVTSKGDQQEVNMMKMTKYLFYTSNEQFQAVELPYGNRSFSMIILLPSQESSVDELLGAVEWSNLQLNYYPVELSLPKFKTRCHTELIDVLKAVGIRKIFEDGALANIADDISIDQFLQDMYLEVNETGAEASAVTVGMIITAGQEEPKVNVMRVDRPFVFAIRENSTGVVLFTGKIGKIEE